MVNRKNLKSVHEAAVLRQFQAYLKSGGIRLEILERPEPPEALVELNGQRTWIEITDAFLDQDHAIGLTSRASEDVEHIPDHQRLIVDPDASFSSVLHSVIGKKYDKSSMRSIAETQGPGILLVGVFTPFTTAEVVAHDEAAPVAKLISSKPIPIFNTIYVYEGTGQRNFHVLYRSADAS